MQRNNLLLVFSVLFTLLIFKHATPQSLEALTKPIEGRNYRATSGNPIDNRDSWRFEPGETRVLGEMEGPGEINHIWFTCFSLNIRYPRALVLRIYWDDSEIPSVETPLGDFFAVGNGMRANVNSLPIKVSSHGRALNSYWRMPFGKNAKVTLTNESPDYEVGVYFMIDWVQHPSKTEEIMYFHARYHQDYDPQYGEFYTVFEGKGRGHYVGTVLSSQNRTGHWYGEGDDIWYIDGEEYSSLYGTGTEDYFNEAWNMRVHTSLYTGCTVYEPRAPDCRVSSYRWHIPDPVIFTESLKFQLERTGYVMDFQGEVLSAHGYRPDHWSSVSYWYQTTIAEPWTPFPPYHERINPEVFIHLIDAVDDINHSDGVELRVNPYSRSTWTRQWFQVVNDRVGAWIEIPFEIKEEGYYSMTLGQNLREDSGIWKLYINGQELYEAGESHIEGGYRVELVNTLPVDEINTTLDFFNIFRKNDREDLQYGQRRERKIGLYKFTPGIHTLRLVCVGSNPQSAHHQTGNLRYNLSADVLSLRKFPYEGLEEWLKRTRLDRERELESEL